MSLFGGQVPGRLRAYDVTGPVPRQTDEQSLWGIAEGMLVHGRTVAVGECSGWEWLHCVLGWRTCERWESAVDGNGCTASWAWRTCERRGLGELFVLDGEGRIER